MIASFRLKRLHGVRGPENQSVGSNGHEEGTELGSLGGSIGSSVQGKVPDNEDIGNAANGVPAPLLGSTLLAKGSKETGQDHDEIGNDGHEDVSTRHASQQTKIKDQERCSQAPVNVTSPEDLAVNLLEGIRNVIMLLANGDLLDGDTVSGGHSKV